LCRPLDFAFGSYVTFFVATDVIDAVAVAVLDKAVVTRTFIRTNGVNALGIGLRAQSQVKGTFVNIDALTVAVTLVTVSTNAVNRLVVLGDAFSVFNTCTVFE
jgi:hypothetical protein